MSSKSVKAGLKLNVDQFDDFMRNNIKSRDPSLVKCLSSEAAVYMSAVIEYMSAECTELAGNATSRESDEITVKDLNKGILNDQGGLHNTFLSAIIAFDKSLYPSTNFDLNIIDSSFTLNENTLQNHVKEIIKSAYIKDTDAIVKTLIDYAQDLYSKMIINDNENPSDLIRRGLSGLLPCNVEDIFLEAVENEYLSYSYSTKTIEALKMDFTIKFALKSILINAYDMYSSESFIDKFTRSDDYNKDDDDNNEDDDYLNITEQQLIVVISCLTTFRTTCRSSLQIDDTDIKSAVQSNKFSDIISMEFSMALGKCEILPDDDFINADDEDEKEQASDGGKHVFRPRRVVYRDEDLDSFDQLVHQYGQEFKSDVSYASGLVRVLKLSIDSILRVIIENGRAIAATETAETVTEEHIKLSSKLLNLLEERNFYLRCVSSIEGLIQENEFTRDLSIDAKIFVRDIAHSLLYIIVRDAIIYSDHRRSGRVTMNDVIFALTATDPTRRLFKLALIKQNNRIAQAGPTILMNLACTGFLNEYHHQVIMKSARSSLKSIEVDDAYASTSIDGASSIEDEGHGNEDDDEEEEDDDHDDHDDKQEKVVSCSTASSLLINNGSQLIKVLGDMHPRLKISKEALKLLQFLLASLLSKLQDSSYILKRKDKCICSREVQSSVRLIIIGDLSHCALAEGSRRLTAFKNKRK